MSVAAEAQPARRRNPRGQGARLRDEIVEVAADMIEESGDSGQLTLRGVAKRVGIAAPSIYRHFATIEHLKLAVVDRTFAAFAQSRDAQRGNLDDPVEALLAGCRTYCQFAVEHPGPYRFMFSHDSPADGRASPAGLAAFSTLTQSIRRCQEAGRATTTDDPSALAAQVWAALHGLALLRINAPNFQWPASLGDMATVAVRRLVGLQPARGAEAPTNKRGRGRARNQTKEKS